MKTLPSLLLAALFASNAAHGEVVTVLNSSDASVSFIDMASQKVIDTIPVGKEPHHLMATPDNKSLIVANSVSNSLVLLDPRTGKVQRWIEGIEDPYQLGFSYDKKWFVTNGLRLNRIDIYRYDGNNFALAKRVPLGGTPSHMAFTGDNKTVFITLQESDELAAVDLATQTVKWKMKIGKAPAGLFFTPGDEYLLVGMTGADYVAVVDWRNQKIVKTIHTDRGAHNFRSLADGRRVLVSNRVGSTISVLDLQSLSVLNTITGLLPGPDDMELTPDKRYLWVTFRFTRFVGVIDLQTMKLVNTIRVGKSPHGIYFPDRASLS